MNTQRRWNPVPAGLAGLIFPPVLLVDAIRVSSFSAKRWAITLFAVLYGSTIYLTEAHDGYRHLQAVSDYYIGLSFEQFVIDLWNILTFQINESGTKDLYRHLLSFLVGTILQAPWLYFPIVAFVYGWFFSGAILIVLRNFKLSKANYIVVGFVAVFLLTRNLEGINTVRTWTGMWILIYAALQYFETREKKYLVLLALPPFIHVAYFLMALPAYAYFILGNRDTLYAALFVLSSITTFVSPGDITNQLERTELGAQSVQSYFIDERPNALAEIESRQGEGLRWYRVLQEAKIERWALNVLLYALIGSGASLFLIKGTARRIFNIGLLTLVLSNSTWFLFAVSNRTALIGMVCVLAGFLMARLDPTTGWRFGQLPAVYKLGVHLSLLMFLPFLIYSGSHFIDYVSFFLIAAPFIVWWDDSLNMSIKEGLRWLLSIR